MPAYRPVPGGVGAAPMGPVTARTFAEDAKPDRGIEADGGEDWSARFLPRGCRAHPARPHKWNDPGGPVSALVPRAFAGRLIGFPRVSSPRQAAPRAAASRPQWAITKSAIASTSFRSSRGTGQSSMGTSLATATTFGSSG